MKSAAGFAGSNRFETGLTSPAVQLEVQPDEQTSKESMEDVKLPSESAFSADSKGINKSTSQRILTMYQYSACFFNGHIGKCLNSCITV